MSVSQLVRRIYMAAELAGFVEWHVWNRLEAMEAFQKFSVKNKFLFQSYRKTVSFIIINAKAIRIKKENISKKVA